MKYENINFIERNILEKAYQFKSLAFQVLTSTKLNNNGATLARNKGDEGIFFKTSCVAPYEHKE